MQLKEAPLNLSATIGQFALLTTGPRNTPLDIPPAACATSSLFREPSSPGRQLLKAKPRTVLWADPLIGMRSFVASCKMAVSACQDRPMGLESPPYNRALR